MAIKKTFRRAMSVALCAAAASFGANLANPAAQVGDARMTFGMSYYIGGADVTNLETPLMMNRVCARVGYSPVRYANFGIDVGAAQVSVDQYSLNGRDSIPVFDGKLGYSVGGHLKLSTPYLFDRVALLAIGNVNLFRSKNDFGAYYGGMDVAAAAGAQLRIADCYISIGPQIYLIQGKNRGADEFGGGEGKYSNVNNMRAWLAFDYIPEDFFGGNHKPYVSVEFTASPKINGTERAPLREFSVSVSIGVVTQRLYGDDADEFDY